MIRDQGEAAKAADVIAAPFRNTADDSAAGPQPLREVLPDPRAARCPAIYSVKDPSEYTADDQKRLKILSENFTTFTAALGELFAGRNPGDFAPLMVTIGGNILTCWKSEVTPKFT